MKRFSELNYSKYNKQLLNEIKELLDSGADPSSDENNTIRCASTNGHTEVVELLIKDPRVDPSDIDNYAIRWCSNFRHKEIVKLLRQDLRVQVKSYQLGQEFHSKEQISELKKTHPFLFI